MRRIPPHPPAASTDLTHDKTYVGIPALELDQLAKPESSLPVPSSPASFRLLVRPLAVQMMASVGGGLGLRSPVTG
jgi:hypothetical protein